MFYLEKCIADCLVGIVTCYGLDLLWIFLFSHQFPCTRLTGFFSGQSGRGVILKTHPLLTSLFAGVVASYTFNPTSFLCPLRHVMRWPSPLTCIKFRTIRFNNSATFIPPTGFEPTFPVNKWLKTYALGRSPAEIVGSNPAEDMDVCCECCVLSGRGLCVGLITRSEEFYRLWCVVVW